MGERLRPLAKSASEEPDLSSHERAGRVDAWLRGARHLLDLTQARMAEAIGEQLSSYKTWESGTHVPKATVIWKVKSLLAAQNRDSVGRLRSA